MTLTNVFYELAAIQHYYKILSDAIKTQMTINKVSVG